MKLKEFIKIAEFRKQLRGRAYDEKQNGIGDDYHYTQTLIAECDVAIAEAPTVNVSFYIGYRSYYQAVTKIGKTYFDGHTKMTQKNGYRSIKEIETITPDMEKSMLADSYYY